MVRLKMAVAGAAAAGALAGGLAMPPAASADTAQVVYAWGDNGSGQAGAYPPSATRAQSGTRPRSGGQRDAAVRRHGRREVRPVAALGRHGVGLGRNSVHQLGDLTQPSSFAPVQIHGLPPGIVQAAAGWTMAPRWPRTDRCGRGAQ